MKYKILVLLLVIILALQFCGKNPVNSEDKYNVVLKFNYPTNTDQAQTSLSKILGTTEYSKIKIVFYNLDIEYDKLYQNYETKSDELYNFVYGFTGDPLDFNDYWVKKDKGELDIISNGNYSIEKRSTLSISNGEAHGNFELAGGMKSCRVGIYDDEVLTWVGKSSGFADAFFELHSHHGEEMGDYYIYINLEQVTPIYRP